MRWIAVQREPMIVISRYIFMSISLQSNIPALRLGLQGYARAIPSFDVSHGIMVLTRQNHARRCLAVDVRVNATLEK